MYNTCMSYRHDDTNWGKHGNPNRDDWYRFTRNYQHSAFDTNSDELKISIWTIIWILLAVLIISGFSETARGWVFYGVNIAEYWYSAVDSLLDALGAPKLP